MTRRLPDVAIPGIFNLVVEEINKEKLQKEI